MITGIRLNNFYAFKKMVQLDLIADMRTHKPIGNAIKIGDYYVLKSSCIYGANNVGKSYFVHGISIIKNIILNKGFVFNKNLFNKSNQISFGISFIYNNKMYDYDFTYDITIENNNQKGFVYESLDEIRIINGKRIRNNLFLINRINNNYFFNKESEISNFLPLTSSSNILIYTINSDGFPILKEYKEMLINVVNNIQVISMENLTPDFTIYNLKNNTNLKNKIINIIKEADLEISDFQYINDKKIIKQNSELSVSQDDFLRLVSIHNGLPVRSIDFDSLGTKKIVSLASYIVDAIENGKTLIVDELESSLHYLLVKSIVALFNNLKNTKGQLLFTTHEIALLDLRLFRKDQINFIDKDEGNNYLYPLSEYTYHEKGIRSESDLFKKYNYGELGGIPNVNLYNAVYNDEV